MITNLLKLLEGGGGGGTSDYSDLTNKPKINSVTLSGNKSAAELELVSTLAQTFTDAQKAQVRENIGAASESELTELEISSIDRNSDYIKTIVNFDTAGFRYYSMSESTGNYGTSTRYKHVALELQEGDIVRIKANSTNSALFAFLTTASFPVSGGAIPSVDGLHTVDAGKDSIFVAPSGTQSIIVYKGKESDAFPSVPEICMLYRKKDKIAERSLDHAAVNGSSIFSSTNFSGYIYKVESGQKYLVNFDTVSACRYAFVSEFPNENNPSSNYVSVNANRKGFTNVITAPFNGWFCAICESSSDVFTTHQFSEFSEEYNISPSDSFIGKSVEKIVDDAYAFDEVSISSLDTRNYSILSDAGRYGNSGTSYQHCLLPVSSGELVKITSNNSHVTTLAWLLNNNTPVAYGKIHFSEGASFTIESGNTAILKVPESAHYLLIYLGTNNNYAPAFLGRGRFAADTSEIDYIVSSEHSRHEEQFEAEFNGLKSASHILDSDGYEVIDKVQLLNVIKKCEQLANITYYPKRQIPMKPQDGAELTDEAWYDADVKVTSYPYSSNNNIGRFSIETFMTAVNNPYSLMYSERIYMLNQHSDWGKLYANNNGFAYYGTVCCGLTSEAVGAPIKFNNPYHDEASRIHGLFAPVYPQSAEGLKVGDIIDGETHSIIVIGIHYTNGVADKFRIAQTSGVGDPYAGGVIGGIVISVVSKAIIEGATYLGRMRAYRYVRLYRNLDYKQSPFVTCTGETALAPYSYNNDICTYAGDKVSFKFGDKVVINYNLTNSQSFAYTKINLYKDGSTTPTTYLLEDIDQSTLPNGDGTTYWLDQRGHALVLDNLAVGDYVAKMADDNGNESEPTTFEVVSTTVTVTNVGNDKYEIEYAGEIEAVYVGEYSYSSSKGDLPFKHFNYASGCMAFPTFWEVDAHKMTIYPKHIAKEGGKPTYGSHLEFIIKSKYGNIRTEAYNIETGEYED